MNNRLVLIERNWSSTESILTVYEGRSVLAQFVTEKDVRLTAEMVEEARTIPGAK